jgi:hypothetical protein
MGGLGTCAGAAAGIRLIYIFISHQLAGGGAGGRAGGGDAAGEICGGGDSGGNLASAGALYTQALIAAFPELPKL